MANDKVLPAERSRGKLKRRVKRAFEITEKTQAAVARDLGTDPSQVNGWAQGKRAPREHYLVLLPTSLDVDGHWLMTGEGDPYQHKRMAVVRRATAAEVEELRAMLDATEGFGGPGGPPGPDQFGHPSEPPQDAPDDETGDGGGEEPKSA